MTNIEYERIRLEIERLRISAGVSAVPTISDPRFDLVRYHLNQGQPATTLNIVREMQDNPAAAIAGYELLRSYYLNQDMPASALRIAREEHGFLKRILGK